MYAVPQRVYRLWYWHRCKTFEIGSYESRSRCRREASRYTELNVNIARLLKTTRSQRSTANESTIYIVKIHLYVAIIRRVSFISFISFISLNEIPEAYD